MALASSRLVWRGALRCFFFCCLWVLVQLLPLVSAAGRPLVITSELFAQRHVPRGYHPECPERIAAILKGPLAESDAGAKYEIRKPSAESDDAARAAALAAIRLAHTDEYVKEVKMRCEKGARALSPWDSDTYLSPDTFDTCVLAQSAWLDGVQHVSSSTSSTSSRFAFAVTRPPGHHAERESGMGFCIFNFAAAAALHAVESKLAKRVAILDIDVHYGNGVASIVEHDERIRYASLHQEGIFPNPPPTDGVQPGPHKNVLTVNLKAGFRGPEFLSALKERALPFLSELGADLVIICAGFDALASEELANGGLRPDDFADISALIKQGFPNTGVLYGLEGGYELKGMPLALEAAVRPWL